MYKAFLISLLLSLLVGCATTTTPQRYLLDNEVHIKRAEKITDVSRHLAIDQIELAGFLDKSGIVYQIEPNQINVASRHLWAEPLNSQLRRNLYDQLSARLEDIAIYQNKTNAPDDSMRLSLAIDSFHGRYDGNALVSGSWQITEQNGQVIERQTFNSSVALKSDGYSELVRALSEGLQEAIVMIAQAIQTL